VCPVEEDLRVGAARSGAGQVQQLEPAGPARRRVARSPGIRADVRDPGGVQRIQHGIRDRHVRRLVSPEQADPDGSQARQLHEQAVPIRRQHPCRAHLDERDPGTSCPTPDRPQGRTRGPGDGEVAGHDDRRFLARDRLDGRPQVLRVVEVDVRDRGDPAIPGVSGVEPAAQAHLDDGEVHAHVREVAERERRQQLELGRRAVAAGNLIGDRQPGADEAREIGRRDRVPGDPDPLAVADEVRLGSLACAIPLRGKAGANERHHAALAVGPADERAANSQLRVPQGRQQGPSPAQAQADPEAPTRLERGNRIGEGGREVEALQPAHWSRSSS
jgi:hypothetical protein